MAELSKSPTPPIRMWFEFLLDDNLLEQHLAQAAPDPTPGELIALFLYQADVSAATAREIREGSNRDIDINHEQFPENRKIKALKLLALKVAGHLKWDLSLLDKGVPLAMVQDILLELLKLTLPKDDAEPVRHKSLDFSGLSGQALFAIQLYHRWCLKTAIQAAFPVKQPKVQNVQVPGLLDPNAATASAKETVLQLVKEGMEDSTIILSRLSEVGRDVAMPTSSTFGSYIGGQEAKHDWAKCVTVKEMELLCHICYDLGAVYFSQQKYHEAYAMFSKATELCAQMNDEVLCPGDSQRLKGYYAACSGLLGKSLPNPSLLQQCEDSRKNGYHDIDKLFLQDNTKLELCVSYRLAVEQEMKKQKADAGLYFNVLLYNALRRKLDSRLLSKEFVQLVKAQPIVIPTLVQSIQDLKPSLSYSQKMSLHQLLRYLWLSYPDANWDGLTADERKEFKDHAKTELSAGPVLKVVTPSDYQQQLLSSYDPVVIKELINKLSSLMGKQQLGQIRGLSDKWIISRELAGLMEAIPIPWVRVFTHVLIAKAQICRSLKQFGTARQLLQVAEATSKDLSYKLARILPWEILRMELANFNTFGTFCGDDQNLNDLKKKARGCMNALDNKHGKHDIRPHEEVLVECVVFLLNVRDWEALITMFNTRNGYIEFGRLVALLCKELPQPKTARKPAMDLWSAMLLVYTNQQSSGVKRNAEGMEVVREARQGPISRQQLSDMVERINEPLVLSVLVSLLSRLYTCLRDDVSVEVCADYSSLWPTTVASTSSLSSAAVEEAVQGTLTRALTLQPCAPSLLRTKADLCFAGGQHASALKHYLAMGLLLTDYFYDALTKAIFDDTLVRRLVRSCSALHCFTQAAVLCQCVSGDDSSAPTPIPSSNSPDYSTAFKALGERVCHDSMDTYYAYMWDVTLLEYLVHIHTRRGQHDRRQVALAAITRPELNASNPPEILFEAARVRKARFLRAMARQYV